MSGNAINDSNPNILNPGQKEMGSERIQQLESKVETILERLNAIENQAGIDPKGVTGAQNLQPMILESDDVEVDVGEAVMDNDNRETNDDDNDPSRNRFPCDSYSLLAIKGSRKNWKIIFFSVMVFLFQVALLLALLLSVVVPDLRSTDTTDGSNPVFPGDVEPIVKFVQLLSVGVVVLFPDFSMVELISAAHLFPNLLATPNNDNYSTLSPFIRFVGVVQEISETNPGYFLFSLLLRLVQGFLANVSTFLLIFTSRTAEDVILNFVALNFISGLDDNAFKSAIEGHFGTGIKEMAMKVETEPLPVHVPKKYLVGRMWLVKGVVYFAMTIAGLAVVLVPQTNNEFLIPKFRLEFGSDSSEYTQYNGCYDRHDEFSSGRRPIYQKDNMTFAYCKSDRKWYFFEAETEEHDACKANMLLYSSLSDSFDIETSFSAIWYSKAGVPVGPQFITEGIGAKEGCNYSIGDGRCDMVLNVPEFDYDGGDCCAETCNHPLCGLGVVNHTFNTSVTPEGDGYQTCRDSDMVDVTMILHSVTQAKFDDFPYETQPPLLLFECDGKSHLAILLTENMTNGSETNGSELIRMRDGAKCRVLIRPGHTVNFSLVHSIKLDSGNSIETDIVTQEIADSTYYVRESIYYDDGQTYFNKTDSYVKNFTLIRECYFSKLLEHVDVKTIYSNEATPERKVIDWILKDDKAQSYSDCDNPFFIERYMAAVAYLKFTYQSFDNVTFTDEMKRQESQCTWDFVTCSGGHVVKLDLSDRSGDGSLATELVSLPKLEELNFDDNQLTGPIPSEIGLLSNLQRLELWDNELTGPIPSEIGLLSNVQLLGLSLNQLTGPIPSEIGLLTNLEELYLDENQLTGPIPSEIGLLSNLQELRLDDNQLTGPIPTEIGLLSNVESLVLFDNQLTGPIPSEIGLLSNVKLLVLDWNNLSGSIPFSFCEMDQTPYIRVDCDKVICHCCGCTQYSQPSSSPFPSVSSSPTTTPSTHPSDLPSLSLSPSATPSKSQMPTREPVIVTIELNLDDYPSDTGWNITDVDNDVIYEIPFDTYTDTQLYETVYESVILTTGSNYIFHLLDSWGDGLEGGHVVIYLGDEPNPNTIVGYYVDSGLEFYVYEIPFLASEEGIIENIFQTASPSISQYPSNSFRPSEMPAISPPLSSPPSKSTLQEETKTAPTSGPSESV